MDEISKSEKKYIHENLWTRMKVISHNNNFDLANSRFSLHEKTPLSYCKVTPNLFYSRFCAVLDWRSNDVKTIPMEVSGWYDHLTNLTPTYPFILCNFLPFVHPILSLYLYNAHDSLGKLCYYSSNIIMLYGQYWIKIYLNLSLFCSFSETL